MLATFLGAGWTDSLRFRSVSTTALSVEEQSSGLIRDDSELFHLRAVASVM
jgi:hypothetical protein